MGGGATWGAVGANPRSDGGSLRMSSLDEYQELKFFCLKCRKENCMDLPHWHWGQVTATPAGKPQRRVASPSPDLPIEPKCTVLAHTTLYL